MKTLIIYDNSGKIFGIYNGNYTVPGGGINYLETKIPENQRPVSVDVDTKELVCEEIPPDVVNQLQEEVTNIQLALVELYEGER